MYDEEIVEIQGSKEQFRLEVEQLVESCEEVSYSIMKLKAKWEQTGFMDKSAIKYLKSGSDKLWDFSIFLRIVEHKSSREDKNEKHIILFTKEDWDKYRKELLSDVP